MGNGRAVGGFRALIAAAVLLGAAIVAAPADASHVINPGDFMSTSEGGCTIGFFYTGGGKTYIGSAAHCVAGIGSQVRDDHNRVIGTVVAKGDPDNNAKDWALVELASGISWSPAVEGHPGYPTGVAAASQTLVGDRVQMSGHGIGFGSSQPTREQRFGNLTFDDANEYAVVAPAIFGDSGGPVVHVPTGRALGIVSRLCAGTCTMMGPTVNGIIAKAGAAGFPVTLVTV